MEAFSLLKYWRGGGGGRDVGNLKSVSNGVATIVTTVTQNPAAETDDDDDGDGPFFDLEFSVNEDEEDDEDGAEDAVEETHKCGENEEVDEYDDEEEEEEEGREFKFTLSSGSSNDRTDSITGQNLLSLSPSDDLFFKGKLVPIEINSATSNSDQPNFIKSQFPVSFLKSATKFRVFMLGLKKSNSKSNCEKPEPSSSSSSSTSSAKEEPKKQKPQQGKFFTVKFKVEEVPIVSLFTRDNSSRVSSSSSSSSSTSSNKPQKQNSDNDTSSSSSSSSSEEKRFAKEVLQRYLKMVKPLYVRVSKRYGEKLRFSGHLSLNGSLTKSPSPAPAPELTEKKTEPEVPEAPTPSPASNAKSVKQVSLPAGLRVVCKHLGKSRSASAAAPASSAPGTASSKRRDDSLLQQQDGIQSAILHCKRSFNSIRGKSIFN